MEKVLLRCYVKLIVRDNKYDSKQLGYEKWFLRTIELSAIDMNSVITAGRIMVSSSFFNKFTLIVTPAGEQYYEAEKFINLPFEEVSTKLENLKKGNFTERKSKELK